MKFINRLLPLLVLCTMAMLHSAYAADNNLPNLGNESSKVQVAKEGLAKDALCTKCHDESETAPVLSLYQTKHGLRGDKRAPSCQSCHGESTKHIKGDGKSSERAPPDVVFKKGVFKFRVISCTAKATEDVGTSMMTFTCSDSIQRLAMLEPTSGLF